MRKVALVIIVGLIVVGVVMFYHTGKVSESTDYTPIILSSIGAMDCYSYSENVSVITGNSTKSFHVQGGYFNETYYFYMEEKSMVLYMVVLNKTLNERVVINNTSREFSVTLTPEETAKLLAYDPVRIAFQAVGAGTKVKVKKDMEAYDFKITLSPSSSIKMIGTITVWIKGGKPSRILISSKLVEGGKTVEKRTIDALLGGCEVPKWVDNIKG